MTRDSNKLTSVEHWDDTWSSPPRMRLPTGLHASTRNSQRLLRTHVDPGMRFLEIGCAPGKMLVWVASVLKAEVAGLDYSERGLGFARQLFQTLAIEGDLRCEDVFATTFTPGSFDIVFSAGVIEHFDDPREIVRRHVTLLKPGGKALITVPRYSAGIHGWAKRRYDPEGLSLHNLSIMSPPALRELAPEDMVSEVRAYPAGRMVPFGVGKRWPRILTRGIFQVINLIGLLQPLDIPALCPTLVLELRRRAANDERHPRR